jgi:hypothetical protein
LTGALLCFNPAVWWLLAQTRLAREQLVDAEVVRLTAAREPYIESLLSIARAGLVPDLAPAPLFLRKRHLTQRMRLLLKEVSMSKGRLWSSYGSIVAIVAFAGWFSCVSFPLTGQPPDARPEVAQVPAARPEQDTTATAVQVAPPRINQHPSAVAASGPPQIAPVPSDPLELVTGTPEAVTTPAGRAQVLALLRRAMMNQFFGAGRTPYTVKISFTASGVGVQGGTGDMEETNNAAGARRWTGSLGDYSLTRIIPDRWYDAGSSGPIPLRLALARGYSFGLPLGPLANGSPAALAASSIRTANVTLNGDALTCILASSSPTTAPGRDWSETEICIDPQSGFFRLGSPAPGMYAVYDYSKAVNFHGHTPPSEVTITVGGSVALQGSITVQDPASLDPALFTPTSEMRTGGAGLVGPSHQIRHQGSIPSSGIIQPVVVHAAIAPDGSVIEAEALQAPDSTLSRSAVSLVKSMKYPSTVDYGYPSELDLYVTVE